MTDNSIKVLLKPQHKMFADAYLVSGKIQESAVKAGYTRAGAHVQGNRLLKRPDVLAYLAEQGSKVSESTEDLQSEVLRELKDLAFANIADLIRIENGVPVVDFSNATREQLAAVTSIATKRTTRTKGDEVTTEDASRFAMADKYRGLELLGKHLGMFKEPEHRVVVDVADRLLNARRRLANADTE